MVFAEDITKDYAAELGFTLKSMQLDAAVAMLRRHDVLITARTGFGKSLLYIMAPTLYDRHDMFSGASQKPHGSAALIVFPLLSMIEDNILKIKKLVPDKVITHLSSDSTLDHELKSSHFILTTPESLLSVTGRSLLRDKEYTSRLRAVFIDECHCIITQYVNTIINQSVD